VSPVDLSARPQQRGRLVADQDCNLVGADGSEPRRLVARYLPKHSLDVGTRCNLHLRAIRAVKLLARDGRIPKQLPWLAALGLLPVPGPFDEAVLLIVGSLLFVFYRGPLREAWAQAGARYFAKASLDRASRGGLLAEQPVGAAPPRLAPLDIGTSAGERITPQNQTASAIGPPVDRLIQLGADAAW
jgi:hypothetical protein